MQEFVSTIELRVPGSQLDHLVRRFRGAVERRARRMLRDDDAAADIVQEVFLRAMQVQESVLQSHPRAWLYRVTTNLCLNHLRNSKRRDELSLNLHATNRVGRECPETLGVMLPGVLRDVPPELLVPALYYYIEDLSQAQIALRLGVSRRTVGNRLVAFHALLRSLQRVR